MIPIAQTYCPLADRPAIIKDDIYVEALVANSTSRKTAVYLGVRRHDDNQKSVCALWCSKEQAIALISALYEAVTAVDEREEGGFYEV